MTDSVTVHLELQPWMSSSLKGNETGGGKDRAWQESQGGRKHKTRKRIQPRPGVGPGHRHCRPSWNGTAEAPQGCTQLLHHSQRVCDPEGVLTHLIRPPSSLPSIFPGCPRDDCPWHVWHPVYLSGPVFPRCGELAPAQPRGGVLLLVSSFCLPLGEGLLTVSSRAHRGQGLG